MYLLNEKNEVIALLNGQRLNKKYTYRSCYLLAKHFKSLGYDMIKTREEIFAWANTYKIYITDDLNSIIQRAFADKHDLTENVEIRISKEDIQEITRRFDKYNTRLIAFALLCFAKKYADKSGIFYISNVGLANWVGMEDTHVSTYMKELIDFDFVDKINNKGGNKIRRSNKFIKKMSVYKIKIKLIGDGIYFFKDLNIREEFENIFSQL